MTAKLIFYYIYWTCRLRIAPWHYFQINAEFYNVAKGYYSKLDIDQHIPKKWRLPQAYLDKNQPPTKFPVFLKPEWGQNANGVKRIDSASDFTAFASSSKIPYIVQQATDETEEYEVFFIRSTTDENHHSALTITQSTNRLNEPYPINNINDKNMIYKDLTDSFNHNEMQKIRNHLAELPRFRIARIGLKTNSKADLLNGNFHIIEINLFAPFPIHLLDQTIDKKTKHQFIKNSMYHLAKISATTPRKHFNRFVFFKKTILHYQSKAK